MLPLQGLTHAPIHSPHALHHTTPDIIPHRVSHTLLPRPLSTLPPHAPLTPSLTHSLTCSVTPSFTHSVISQPSSGAWSHPKNADSNLQTKTPGWVWTWCPWRDSSLGGMAMSGNMLLQLLCPLRCYLSSPGMQPRGASVASGPQRTLSRVRGLHNCRLFI